MNQGLLIAGITLGVVVVLLAVFVLLPDRRSSTAEPPHAAGSRSGPGCGTSEVGAAEIRTDEDGAARRLHLHWGELTL